MDWGRRSASLPRHRATRLRANGREESGAPAFDQKAAAPQDLAASERQRMAHPTAMGVILIVLCAIALAAQPAEEADYLADHPHLLTSVLQGWGELGLNACAHAPGTTPLPMEIAGKRFARGLGHHAPGEIVVDLDGAYTAFAADVGVQKQASNMGSVVFRVLVDGKVRFDSGLMRESTPARSVRVDLRGSRELRLVVTDGGDGITCDVANWANARLLRPAGAARPERPLFDVAPFARLVTSDPARKDGARSNRIQEYRAEDIALDQDVPRLPSGAADVPIYPGGQGCIGLHWLERRRLARLEALWARDAAPASPEGATVEAWVGESHWQGEWRPVRGAIRADGARWTLDIDPSANPDVWRGVRAVRWIVPSAGRLLRVERLAAWSPARVGSVRLRVEAVEPPAAPVAVTATNGWLLASDGSELPSGESLALRAPQTVTVRYTLPRPWRSDRTVLRFAWPGGGFGVAVDDVLASGYVFVKRAGVLVAREDYPRGVRAVAAKPGAGRTVLERVRSMPEQTLERALERARNPIQDLGPMLLSLACDNRKFVAEREGAVRGDRVTMTPTVSGAEGARLARSLEGGWLPAPVTYRTLGALTVAQRTYVVPMADEPLPEAPAWLHRRPLCVAEFTVSNRGPLASEAAITLAFAPAGEGVAPVSARMRRGGAAIIAGGALLAFVDTQQAGALEPQLVGASVRLSGRMPARSTARFRVCLPGWDAGDDDAGPLADLPDLLPRLRAYWQGALAEAMDARLPDPFVDNLLRASQAHCLLAARNEGEGARIAPWIAAMAYGPLESESNSIIRGMDLLGHHTFARKSLDFFVARYSPEGFLTTGYTLMGTGWHLQTLGEHVALTADADWARRVAPEVERVCAWIERQMEKTRREDPATGRPREWGLMPPGVMADWNAFAYYFCLNGYYAAGLAGAADALSLTGSAAAPRARRAAADLRRETLRAFLETQALAPVVPLQDGTWVRAYPSQVHVPGPTNDFFPGEDSNRSWAYDIEIGAHQLVPQGVLAPSAPEVSEMLDHMEDVAFLSEGWFDYPAEESRRDWFHRGGFAKVQPYYCRNAEIYALRDDVKPFLRTYFNALASLVSTENLSFWEHFRNGGAWNKTHETGYFLQQSRWMLVQERGDELWLAPFVPSAWLADGKRIEVRRAPTLFGPVAYTVRSRVAKGRIEVAIEPPARRAPKAIVVRLRHPDGRPIKAVTVDGAPHRDFDPAGSTVRVSPAAGRREIVVHY